MGILTYVMHGEDDTLGNALRFIISTYKEVEACHYTRPHPTEDKIHFRIQTYAEYPGGVFSLKNVYSLKGWSSLIVAQTKTKILLFYHFF